MRNSHPILSNSSINMNLLKESTKNEFTQSFSQVIGEKSLIFDLKYQNYFENLVDGSTFFKV